MRLILIFFVTTIVGCNSTRYLDYRNIRAVGLSHNVQGAQSTGIVRSEDCGWQVMGYPVSAPPSFEDAMENAVSLNNTSFKESVEESVSSKTRLLGTKIKLLTNVQARNEGWNIYVLGRECIRVSALAYQ